MGLPSLNPSTCIGKPVNIYALIDPRDQTAFYVGATSKSPRQRLSSHLNDACHLMMRGTRCDIMRAIAAAGMRTDIVTLEVVAPDNWPEAEQFWIANLRFLGAVLTNVGVGGPGALGTKQSKETQLRRRAAQKGCATIQMHTPEARARAAAKLRGRSGKKASEETRRRLSESHKGKKWTPEHRAKMLPHFGKPRRKTGKPAHNRRPLIIDGIEYLGRPDAASARGVSLSTITNWIRSGLAIYKDAIPSIVSEASKNERLVAAPYAE